MHRGALAIDADGRITAGVDLRRALVREALKYLPRFRSFYGDLDIERHGVQLFLEQRMQDGQKFGGRCKSTAWMGLALCKRAGEQADDTLLAEQYRDLLVRTLDELFGEVRSGSASEKQAIVDELVSLVPVVLAGDAREAAYCAASSPEVFHAVAHGTEVFDQDPFDVDAIHSEARYAFARLVDRAADAQFGKILLIKGVAGSGKTHLMRAFRQSGSR